ncbi:hypothetical protein [Acidocella sp.]|nr:hypothetical protein [Acidocella sp.]MDD2794517.1 hypothetical protein [Acidocella sp.]
MHETHNTPRHALEELGMASEVRAARTAGTAPRRKWGAIQASAFSTGSQV